jgi:proprotein convertase subtilisin/kexin type 1
MQHLIAWTAQYKPVKDVFGWKTNSAGFKVNSRFGFGLLDANALTQAAINWINVPPKTICEVNAIDFKQM